MASVYSGASPLVFWTFATGASPARLQDCLPNSLLTILLIPTTGCDFQEY
jgi:hypothetical protein